MSDWEDFCESSNINPHDPDQFDRLVDKWSKDDKPTSSDEKDYFPPNKKVENIYFETFQQAAEWSKNNQGKPFTRSPDGRHFVPKNITTKNVPSRFAGLQGHDPRFFELTSIIYNLSPYIKYTQTKTLKTFSSYLFIEDLNKLTKENIIELKILLWDFNNWSKEFTLDYENYLNKYRPKGKDSLSSMKKRIEELEYAVSLINDHLINMR